MKKKKDLILHFPERLSIETIFDCNAKCLCCPTPRLKTGGVMEPKMFKNIIDEASNHPIKDIFPFIRGEPLLDPNIIDYLEYVRNKLPIVNIHFSSNGLLCSPKISQKLLNLNIASMTFSIHRHDINSCREYMGLNYEKILKNVNFFLSIAENEDKKPNVSIISVDIPDHEKSNALSIKNKYNWVSMEFWPGHNRAGNVPYNSSFNFEQGIYVSNLNGCYSEMWLYEWFFIFYDGNVSFCCNDWLNEWIIGNIEHHTLKELWNSKKNWKFRHWTDGIEEAPLNFICRNCILAVKEPPGK